MPVLIDIEVPQGSTFLMLRRDDGSMTVSVEPRAAVDAVQHYLDNHQATERTVEFQPPAQVN